MITLLVIYGISQGPLEVKAHIEQVWRGSDYIETCEAQAQVFNNMAAREHLAAGAACFIITVGEGS